MKVKGSYCGAYSALGGVFEYLNDDCGYEKWSQYLIEKLRLLGAGATGVDVGCGNGYFTRALYKAGYNVTGVDVSPQMLTTAVELARKEGVTAKFLQQDILKLTGFKADFIIAVNDCLNYVSQTDLKRAFLKVYKNLKSGGIFIFDISSKRKLEDIVGSNLFAEDKEDVTWLWFNTLNGDRVDMDITVFTRDKDGKYIRRDERQTQFIHTEEEVLKCLEEVGFSAQSEGHLGGSKDERINFICKKP